MQKRVLIGLGAIATLLLVAMLALFVWARAILGTEAVRAALAAQITQALGQPVAIGGLSASIYPRVTVTLTDLTVGSSIAVRALAIGADLRALLSRRIEHASLQLDGARIVLPLPPLMVGAGSATTSATPPVEIISIDEIALRGVEIVSQGHVLRGDIDVVPQGAGLLANNVTLTAGDMTLRATGRIADLAGPVGELSLTGGSLDFDELLRLADAFSRDAVMESASPASPALTARPGAMRVNIALIADHATIGGMTIEQVAGRALVTASEVTIEPLEFGLFGGRYEGMLRVGLDSTPLAFRWNARVSNVDVAAAAAFAGSPDTISGRLTARVDLLGEGSDAATAMRTVRGNARIDVTDGIVKHLGLVRSVGAATKLSLDGLRAAASAESTDEPFSRLGGTIMVSDGTASTDDLRFEARDLTLSARGTARLDASALNFAGRLQLSESLSGEVHHTFLRISQDEGRVVLPATITGPLAAPVVRIDTADITRRALRNVATEGAPKLLRGVTGILRK